MITVYYAKAEETVNRLGREVCLQQLEEHRKDKLLRTGDEKCRVRILATGALLHYSLCGYLGLSKEETAPFPIDVEKDGKPYLIDYPKVHFNMSHSGEYVCCAVGDEPVGVDIQKHVPVREGLAERFFTEKDRELLADAKEQMFFRMWSVKESYIKFTGLGMKQGLDSFEIDWERMGILDKEDKKRACFTEFTGILGYSLALCRGNSTTEVIWKEVV